MPIEIRGFLVQLMPSQDFAVSARWAKVPSFVDSSDYCSSKVNGFGATLNVH